MPSGVDPSGWWVSQASPVFSCRQPLSQLTFRKLTLTHLTSLLTAISAARRAADGSDDLPRGVSLVSGALQAPGRGGSATQVTPIGLLQKARAPLGQLGKRLRDWLSMVASAVAVASP